jgi:hypothetical protein
MSPYLLLRGGSLVRDLPDAVNPEQIVKVDPFMGLAGGRVEAELYGGSIAHLRHRYDSADHIAQTFTQPAISQSLFNRDFSRRTEGSRGT